MNDNHYTESKEDWYRRMDIKKTEANYPKAQLVYDKDGDQYTCYREDFINLQESHCGYGDNHQFALEDLLRQESED